jgi:hypothetical protein
MTAPKPLQPSAGLTAALPLWLHASDVQGLSQLATQGVLGVANLSETVQGNVYKTVAAAFGPLGKRFVDSRSGSSGVKPFGITGLVYGSIRAVTRLAGGTAHAALATAAPLLARRHSSPQREAMLSALNGVLGDHLRDTANPLAIAMQLRRGGQPLVLDPLPMADMFPQATGKLLVTVHGLCMNDLQWQSAGRADAASHGDLLARHAGYTVVDVHYNTGLSIDENGAALAALLARLVAAWPRPVDELALLAHSMGGLVARSACHHADAAAAGWRARLTHIVFLGTPHLGAPLEQTGGWIDRMLRSNVVTRPFAAIGQLRSRGITDLRQGNLRASSLPDDASAGNASAGNESDAGDPLPLPAGMRCLCVAGRLGKPSGSATQHGSAAISRQLSDQLIGDGLVPLASALGEHADPSRALGFAPDNVFVAEGVNHMALLTSATVGAQLLRWLPG